MNRQCAQFQYTPKTRGSAYIAPLTEIFFSTPIPYFKHLLWWEMIQISQEQKFRTISRQLKDSQEEMFVHFYQIFDK